MGRKLADHRQGEGGLIYVAGAYILIEMKRMTRSERSQCTSDLVPWRGSHRMLMQASSGSSPTRLRTGGHCCVCRHSHAVIDSLFLRRIFSKTRRP